MIHGRNLIVTLDGVAVAAAKTCSLDMDQSFLEACSPVSGRTHTKIPTTYDWGVSVDGLVANNSSPTVSLQDQLIAGTKCLLTFTDGSGNRRAGFVYVKSCKESGSVGGLATFSASFESTGALYKCSIYNIDYFVEGASKEVSVSNTGVISYIWTGGAGIKGVGFTISKRARLVSFLTMSWVVYNTSFADVKSYLSNQDGITLNTYAVANNTTAGDIYLEPGTYTMLGFAYSSPTTFVLLYE